MPTGLRPLILPDADDSDDDITSPEAPPYSPTSFTDDIIPSYETVPQDSDDESNTEPQLEDETEFESNVCNCLLYVPALNSCIFSYFHRLVVLHHKQTCGSGTSLWEII